MRIFTNIVLHCNFYLADYNDELTRIHRNNRFFCKRPCRLAIYQHEAQNISLRAEFCTLNSLFLLLNSRAGKKASTMGAVASSFCNKYICMYWKPSTSILQSVAAFSFCSKEINALNPIARKQRIANAIFRACRMHATFFSNISVK